MNVIGKKWIFLSLSGSLVLLSVIAVALFGLRPAIDFAGGTRWQLKFTDGAVTKEKLEEFLSSRLKVSGALVTPTADGAFIVRLKELTPQDHTAYLTELKSLGTVDELEFVTIGASVGRELRGKALIALGLVLLTISSYIAFAFRKVSHPVRSWKYGAITLLTLFHDAVIPVGLFAVLGWRLGAEVDVNFIVAVLVVVGFSVHDTIVVFDRIRENLRTQGTAKIGFDELVNQSVNQTMARSVNTSLTLVLVLLAMYFFGSSSLHYFTLTILTGTIVGTYSSIFVASPLLTLWRSKTGA